MAQNSQQNAMTNLVPSIPSTPPSPISHRIFDLTPFIDRVSADDKVALDDSFANIFYSTGVPFSVANSTAMKSFCKRARPAWSPPSSYQVSHTLLDKAYNLFTISKNSYILDCQEICLVTDGWSNLRNQHLVNFIIVFPNSKTKPLLYKTINTGEIEQSSINIAAEIERVILELGLNKVVGSVTDNAPNMRGAWIILEDNYPGLICNGCGAHTMNLLVKDVCNLPRFEPTLTTARAITSFVKKRTAVRQRFKTIQQQLYDEREINKRLDLIYVGDTRWYTHHGCTRRIVDNEKVLKSLKEKDIVKRISGTSRLKRIAFENAISNPDYWIKLKAVEKVLKPTSVHIGNYYLFRKIRIQRL